ncbi:hypothetical protein EW145_g6476 [Phellinidium pouzarii]|uniref:Uncharacterized protein n=1 Tax=Phellinidium pouzarii TaxID=167371 RepID=A0A4V3XBT0_9AGAM|nr:hypothetical protein EW145_g6476 [Phellinidium pouzarii]
MQVYTPPPMSPMSFARHQANRRSQLLTPTSHFPSRMLPPPGTMPRILPGTRTTKRLDVGSSLKVTCLHGAAALTRLPCTVQIGTTVEVRRFNMRMNMWMPWIPGVIIGRRMERFHAGTEVELYDVQTMYPNVWMETYIPFLGELRDGLHYSPSDSACEMMDKVAELKKVYACVQLPQANGSIAPAWVPAIVTTKRTDPSPVVFVLSGQLGQKYVPAPHILPFNPETAQAIIKTGQIVCWEKGAN